ncbi:DUF4380 domain-containing protein, partial [Xanthomonas citri pv. citri]
KQIKRSAARADTVEIGASARNIRAQPIAWDLWFNTRLAATTRVFVPVAAATDIRLQPPREPGTIAPRYQQERGLLALRADARPD